ncbi:MAG: amidase [Geminicoccaceae bacterium]|nr:amidase [Geminicoccaceae bacterium]
MNFEEYRREDAVGLASLVARGDVKPVELLDLALARRDEVDGDLNTITIDDEPFARRTLADVLPVGRFSGVPFLLKDLYAFLGGTAISNGSRLVGSFVAPHDSTLIARMRQAGVVIFGKTNAPEFGLNVTTEPKLHGPTRNPWNREYMAGGSSGGSAAAVAAGIVPMAHATDGGGSIRIPASCCGLVGLKPSRQRNPTGPDLGEGWNGLACGHVISRSVRDTALMLDALSGPEPGDIYACPPSPVTFSEALEIEPMGLRVALMLDTPSGQPVHDDCREATLVAAKALEEMGHHVEEACPKLDAAALRDAMMVVVCANVANDLPTWSKMTGHPVNEENVERCTLLMMERGFGLPAARLVGALQIIQRAARTLGRFFQSYDLLLSPTLGLPPARLGWLDQDMDDLDVYVERQMAQVPLTQISNMTGLPSISLPLHWNGGGLPIGVMLGTRLGGDDLLVSLAARLEEARPWKHRHAPV